MCVCMCLRVRMFSCAYACVHVRACTLMCVCMYVYACLYMRVCVRAYMRACVCVPRSRESAPQLVTIKFRCSWQLLWSCIFIISIQYSPK